jgi:hypothetical protein
MEISWILAQAKTGGANSEGGGRLDDRCRRAQIYDGGFLVPDLGTWGLFLWTDRSSFLRSETVVLINMVPIHPRYRLAAGHPDPTRSSIKSDATAADGAV